MTEPVDWQPEDLELMSRCPACGGSEIAVALTDVPDPEAPRVRMWRIDRCADCRTFFLNPRPTESSIGKAYEGRYYTHTAPPDPDEWPATRGAAVRARLLKGYVNRRFGYRLSPHSKAGGVIVPLLPGGTALGRNHVRDLPAPAPGARLLDVGCGNGAFLLRMRAAGWEVEGIEPDPAARAFATDAGLPVQAGPLTAGPFEPASFDAVTMNHVLEHLHEPLRVLAACARILRPGGVLWIAAPNGAANGLERYQRHWFPLDPPRHLIFFTPDALRAALSAAGFDEISQPPAALLALRWTYRVSRAFEQGAEDPLTAATMPRGDALHALLADIRTLRHPGSGEELVVTARKAG